MNDFFLFAESSSLNNKQIENSINKFKKRLESAYNLISISFLNQEMKERYIKIVLERVARLGL